MISTLFFLLLLAFYLWYLSSPQVKLQPVRYQAYITSHPRHARVMGSVLLVFTAVVVVLHLGWMTGLSTWFVGLMGVGGLVVALAPFRYLSMPALLLLYASCFLLEIAF